MIHAKAWEGIANYNFVQRVTNEILESCFLRLDLFFSLFVCEIIFSDIFKCYHELVTFCLQNVIVHPTTVLTLKPETLPTYFQKLTFKTCWSELHLAIGRSTPLLQGKKLKFKLCKHGSHFSLIIDLKSTLPTESSEYCCFHCQRAVTWLLW